MAEQALEKQRPINSPLKSKRTVWREPENPVRWAYAKLLREHSNIKKTYAVNPYAEVYQFRDNVYGIYTESLDGMGDPWIYLIAGPERAMLIDTGFGAGNLKGLVKEIIGDMPLVVVNTHAHFDHAYGNFAFDRVYCHEYEVPVLTSKRNPHIWDYLFDENGRGRWADFDRADIVPFREYEIVGVPDGYIFNLGKDHDVELIFLPGHSVGHAGYLDRKNRIFFAGDDACVGAVGVGGAAPDAPYHEYATVEALRNELVKIIKRTDEFDAIFPGHGPVDTGTIVLNNVLEACEAVLKDPQCYDNKTETIRDGVKRIQFGKLIYLSGYLRYNGKSIYMNREVEISK